jgi:hypothetical protein
MDRIMNATLARLCNITRRCRESMHEPDEQGVEVAVFDGSFDNAMMDHTEAHIKLHRTDATDASVEVESFNLACLIALARRPEAPPAPATRSGVICGCCGEGFDLVWDTTTVGRSVGEGTTLMIEKQYIKEADITAISKVFIRCPHCGAERDVK